MVLVLLGAARVALAQDATTPAAATETAPPPVSDVWTEWDVRPIDGAKLLESADTTRSLFADKMETHRALTDSARSDLSEYAARLGYFLDRIEIEKPDASVVRAVLYLRPRLIIREVKIKLGTQITRVGIKEALRQRMRLRVGEVLDENPSAELAQEATLLQQYLQGDGFFDAEVSISSEPIKSGGARVIVRPVLGTEYKLGKITIEPRGHKFAFGRDEIVAIFHHCWVQFTGVCWLEKRFNAEQLQADKDHLEELYQKRGYPGAHVQAVFDPNTSFDRRTHTVEITVRIDERRKVGVAYEGNGQPGCSDEELDKELTFNDAGAADATEIAESGTRIQRHYQKLGWFDAAVSFDPEIDRAGGLTLITYRIDPGELRKLRAVDLVGEHDLSEDELRAVMVTRPPDRSFKLTGGVSSVTREELDGDVQRLLALYQARGYLKADVTVHAAPTRDALGDAALTAAALGSGAGGDDLYVRFDITEGDRAEVSRVDIVFDGAHAATEAQVRQQLGIDAHSPFIVGNLEHAGQRLQDWFWHLGRPRAKVDLSTTEIDANHAVAIYTITENQEVRIRNVIVRGNFRTSRWVILDQLGFDKGALLTDDLYARGLRRLRSTGLFSAISLDIPEFEESHQEDVDVVVHVEERYEPPRYMDAEAGYSSIKSVYVKLAPVWHDIGGTGMSLELGGTLGKDFKSLDFDYKVPRWVSHKYIRINPDVDLSLFARSQNTDRFGTLNSFGGSLAGSRVWQRSAEEGHEARAISLTLRYDVRQRNIKEDTVRVAGNGGSSSATVTNRAESIGVSLGWDQRVDATGNLNPLSPAHGFRLEAGVSLATHLLLGQDSFLKVDGIGQWITQTSKRTQLRLEGRFDEGYPLGGAVLLPEVERFFGGGDDTVRGFPQDRLAVERIVEPLPPFDGILQEKLLPAGGNIRMLATVDFQVKLWQLSRSFPVASAIFVDAGVITNTYGALGVRDIRPSVGVALARILSAFGDLSLEWAIPMFPRSYDPPLGRFHIVVALRY